MKTDNFSCCLLPLSPNFCFLCADNNLFVHHKRLQQVDVLLPSYQSSYLFQSPLEDRTMRRSQAKRRCKREVKGTGRLIDNQVVSHFNGHPISSYPHYAHSNLEMKTYLRAKVQPGNTNTLCTKYCLPLSLKKECLRVIISLPRNFSFVSGK